MSEKVNENGCAARNAAEVCFGEVRGDRAEVLGTRPAGASGAGVGFRAAFRQVRLALASVFRLLSGRCGWRWLRFSGCSLVGAAGRGFGFQAVFWQVRLAVASVFRPFSGRCD